LGIGDWGLGQSPIPNPQSPIPNPHVEKEFIMKNKWIFSDTGILHNEEKINKYDKKDFKLQKTLDINEDDVKLRETFLLFNKLKNKFI
jgi:hypothetical protein